MRVKYLEDTDTALLEFNDREIAESREISENVYVDLDESGNVENITNEHARSHTNLPELAYESMQRRA